MNEKETKNMIVDDMLLTVDMPTTAGSKMLAGYQSPIAADAILRAEAAGYTLLGKAEVGEFVIDLLGETDTRGARMRDGVLKNATVEMLLAGEALLALCLDVNGYPRRAAAQEGLICLKSTFGAISRQGVVSVAPSGETVDILARNTEECRELFHAVSNCDSAEHATIHRVAVLTSFQKDVNDDVKQAISTAVSALENSEISITYIKKDLVSAAKAAWNIILCAELCKNTARYDGVRYGYCAEKFSGLDELYTNSRTEGFGDLVKAAILYGSEVLSARNYQNVYDKALRVRRVIADEFSKLFEKFDAILLPVCSQMEYIEEQIAHDKYIAFEENRFTAPASLTGLPAVVTGGVQLIGKTNSEHALLNLAKILAGEGE